MALFSVPHIAVKGVSVAVPGTIASNRDLPFTDEEKNALIRSTGIEQRRIADDRTCASDLCTTAAEKLLQELGWGPEEIDVLVFVTQTPDYILPGSAMIIQHKLGLSQNSIPFDLNQGCAGYVYGLSFISSFMSSSGLKKGLLLVGDTITKLISKEDYSILPLFSDAGSATAIELDTTAEPMYFNMGANGKDYSAICVPAGGMRQPLSAKTPLLKEEKPGSRRSDEHLYMNGHAVFNFGLKNIAPSITELLTYAGKEKEAINQYVLHQANQLLNEAIRKKLGVDSHAFPYSLKEYGNTSCATIPVTMVSQCKKDLENSCQQLVLSGFGVGLSWASVYLTTHKIICPDVIVS